MTATVLVLTSHPTLTVALTLQGEWDVVSSQDDVPEAERAAAIVVLDAVDAHPFDEQVPAWCARGRSVVLTSRDDAGDWAGVVIRRPYRLDQLMTVVRDLAAGGVARPDHKPEPQPAPELPARSVAADPMPVDQPRADEAEQADPVAEEPPGVAPPREATTLWPAAEATTPGEPTAPSTGDAAAADTRSSRTASTIWTSQPRRRRSHRRAASRGAAPPTSTPPADAGSVDAPMEAADDDVAVDEPMAESFVTDAPGAREHAVEDTSDDTSTAQVEEAPPPAPAPTLAVPAGEVVDGTPAAPLHEPETTGFDGQLQRALSDAERLGELLARVPALGSSISLASILADDVATALDVPTVGIWQAVEEDELERYRFLGGVGVTRGESMAPVSAHHLVVADALRSGGTAVEDIPSDPARVTGLPASRHPSVLVMPQWGTPFGNLLVIVGFSDAVPDVAFDVIDDAVRTMVTPMRVCVELERLADLLRRS